MLFPTSLVSNFHRILDSFCKGVEVLCESACYKNCAAALHHKLPVAPSPRDQLQWSEEVPGMKVWHKWDFYSEYQHKEVAVVQSTTVVLPCFSLLIVLLVLAQSPLPGSGRGPGVPRVPKSHCNHTCTGQKCQHHQA